MVPRRPESVLVLVYTGDAEVLLLKRRQPFEFWQSVTGSLRAGESHAEAARRELFEETGLSDDGQLKFSGTVRQFEIDPRWRDRYPDGVTMNDEYEWHYRLGQKPGIRLQEDEHSSFRWSPIDEAIDTVWSWTNREALEALKTKV